MLEFSGSLLPILKGVVGFFFFFVFLFSKVFFYTVAMAYGQVQDTNGYVLVTEMGSVHLRI